MKKLILFSLIFTAGTIITMFATFSPEVLATHTEGHVDGNAQQVCDQIKKVDPSANCDKASSQSAFSDTMGKIIGIMSYAIGVISIIVIIIGAIMFSVSTGDPQKTKRAKDAVLYAVIGIVVALLGQAIVRFVISEVA